MSRTLEITEAHVFISYSHQDYDYARKLADALADRGFLVWFDDRVSPGIRWREIIEEQIDTCAAFIVILSKHARDSDGIRREVELAERQAKPIMPLLLGGEIWFGVRGVRYVDVSNGELPPDEFYAMLRQAVSFPESAPSLSGGGGLLRPLRSLFRGRPTSPPQSWSKGIDDDHRAEETPASEPVQMSAYYPQEVAPQDWHPLKAYIYRQSAAAQVRQDAKRRLGALWDFFNRGSARATRQIAAGAHVTATPQLDGFEFDPLSVTIAFREAWHRLDFNLRAVDAPLDQDALGSITFTVEGIVVADVPLSIFVSETATTPQGTSTTAQTYEKIFCSYSHDDQQIADRVQAVCEMMDFEYLRDVYTLKSGEAWNPRLLELIEAADVFQLFWSLPASESKYVRQEWEHALVLKDKPPRFVRPYYWQKPMPEPPAELGHLHFEYEPRLAG